MILEPSSSLISIYPLVLLEFPHAVYCGTAVGQTQSYFTEPGSFNRGYVGKLHLHTFATMEKKIWKTVFLMLDCLVTERPWKGVHLVHFR